jgi:Leucine-rich repeat (LRR) protein
MQNLVLNDSSLTEFPEIPAGRTFYKINIRENKIIEIPPLNCHVLKIDARKNLITVIPDDWPPMLEVLDLGYNFLHEVAFLDINLPPLKELWLNNNLLFKFPIRLPDSLEFLSIDHNQIQKIPADLLPKNLEILFASNCGLKYTPSLTDFHKLKRLDLSYNNLTNITDLPPNLEELYLNNNQLTEFPSLPSKVHHVDIAKNKLSKFPSFIQASLTVINLSHNQITEVNTTLARNSIICSINLLNNWITKEPIIEQSEPRHFFVNLNKNFLDNEFEWNQILVARRFQTIMWIKFCRIIARTQRIKQELLEVAMHPDRLGNF